MNKYMFYRVVKLKKKNIAVTIKTMCKETIPLTIIYMFFVCSMIFENSKKQEIITQNNRIDDLASVDTSGELIGILSIFEKLFFLLGLFMITIYAFYLIIFFTKKYMITKENFEIKKLNGGSVLEIAIEFTLEQIFEIPMAILMGIFIARLIVMNFISTIRNFWLFSGLTLEKLDLLSDEIISSIIIFLISLFVSVLFVCYRKVKKIN